eukprot:scaffold4747_cov52-Phaeocystis_antarctica.AAC.2
MAPEASRRAKGRAAVHALGVGGVRVRLGRKPAEVRRDLAHDSVDGVPPHIGVHRVGHVPQPTHPDDIEVEPAHLLGWQRAKELEDATSRDDTQRDVHGDVPDQAELCVLLGHRPLEEDRDAPLHECIEGALPSECVAPRAKGEAGFLVHVLGEHGHAAHAQIGVVHLLPIDLFVHVGRQPALARVSGILAFHYQELPQRRPADRQPLAGRLGDVHVDGPDKRREEGPVCEVWHLGRRVCREVRHRQPCRWWVVLAPLHHLTHLRLVRLPIPLGSKGRYLGRENHHFLWPLLFHKRLHQRPGLREGTPRRGDQCKVTQPRDR